MFQVVLEEDSIILLIHLHKRCNPIVIRRRIVEGIGQIAAQSQPKHGFTGCDAFR